MKKNVLLLLEFIGNIPSIMLLLLYLAKCLQYYEDVNSTKF